MGLNRRESQSSRANTCTPRPASAPHRRRLPAPGPTGRHEGGRGQSHGADLSHTQPGFRTRKPWPGVVRGRAHRRGPGAPDHGGHSAPTEPACSFPTRFCQGVSPPRPWQSPREATAARPGDGALSERGQRRVNKRVSAATSRARGSLGGGGFNQDAQSAFGGGREARAPGERRQAGQQTDLQKRSAAEGGGLEEGLRAGRPRYTYPAPLYAHTHFLPSVRAALVLDRVHGQALPAPALLRALGVAQHLGHPLLVSIVETLESGGGRTVSEGAG